MRNRIAGRFVGPWRATTLLVPRRKHTLNSCGIFPGGSIRQRRKAKKRIELLKDLGEIARIRRPHDGRVCEFAADNPAANFPPVFRLRWPAVVFRPLAFFRVVPEASEGPAEPPFLLR